MPACVRLVLVPIFGDDPVLAVVTALRDGSGARRLFLSTTAPWRLAVLLAWTPAGNARSSTPADAILHACGLRWRIETCCQETRAFWNFEEHMVRTTDDFRALASLIAFACTSAKILPFRLPALARLRGASSQVARLAMGRKSGRELFSGDLGQWKPFARSSSSARGLRASTAFDFGMCFLLPAWQWRVLGIGASCLAQVSPWCSRIRRARPDPAFAERRA